MSEPLQGRSASPLAAVLKQFHSYPFSSDEVFQQGLSGILAHESTSNMPDDERSELILKTQVFYFNRVADHAISLEDVQAHYTGLDDSPQSESGHTSSQLEHEVTRTLTFAELKCLIEQGTTEDIPNNKAIPDTLNDHTPTMSNAPLRKKPWEVASQS
ncbi:hypothetical protein BU15DRAFT_72801 [Melanogaster broomeanus]|nr:hypothetical protein BU15DRAFT_72801 [Melanogaster broomeanus]